MSNEVAIKEFKGLEDFTKVLDFKKSEGQGGLFLVAPVDQYKVFSKEMLTEDQKMLANTAHEYAINKMKPLKEDLESLNKDLTLEIIKELQVNGFFRD